MPVHAGFPGATYTLPVVTPESHVHGNAVYLYSNSRPPSLADSVLSHRSMALNGAQ